ncbi:hypothetical protein ACWJIJ_00510 [Morganella morganii]
MFIQDIPKDKKFWVVRSGDAGVFYEHFVRNGIVAIGHLDNFDYDEKILSNSNEVNKLIVRYKKQLIEKKETLSASSNKAGQVLRFINELSIGDYIITLDPQQICVGVITSESYKDSDYITIVNDDVTHDDIMKYTLRRKVDWGKNQNRKTLPLAINNSFRANQTVFSVSEHWKALNHWLSVAFISDDEAYISSRIEQKDGIHNLDITQYSTLINKIEAIAETLISNDISEYSDSELIDLFNVTYKKLRKNRDFTVTTQQVFLSPGDLWAKIKGSRDKSLIVVYTFLLLFQVSPSFANDRDKDFVSLNHHAIVTILDIVKENEDFPEVKAGLKLRIPSQKIDKKIMMESVVDNQVSVTKSQSNGPDYDLADFEGM